MYCFLLGICFFWNADSENEPFCAIVDIRSALKYDTLFLKARVLLLETYSYLGIIEWFHQSEHLFRLLAVEIS